MNKFFKVAAHALIKRGDKYLITKRSESDDYMPGLWDLPGGTIRFGESIEQALKREVKEEVDLDILIGEIVFVCGYISETDENRHQFQMIFECANSSGEVKLDPRFHSDYKWINLHDLSKFDKIAFLKDFTKKIIGARPKP